MIIFMLQMGQSQQSQLKNKKKSTRGWVWLLVEKKILFKHVIWNYLELEEIESHRRMYR